MAVFRYTAVDKRREDYVESGTVRARDEGDAKKKLERLDFVVTRVKRLGGISGFLKGFTVDVK